MLTASVVLGLVAAVLRGGDLRRLAHTRIIGWWAVVGAFLIKLALVRFAAAAPWLQESSGAIGMFVYAVVLVVLVANRGLPYLPLVWLGFALNFVAVAANGGRMPVFAGALTLMGKQETLDRITSGADPIHRIYDGATALPWLGDWIPVPAPVASVASPGDLFLCIGVILMIDVLVRRPQAFNRLGTPIAA